MKKAPEAFRTIGEVAELLETPAHVLRFWESKFYQIKPVKRAGGRRYYRPDDVALIAGIRHLLQDKGMTIRGVQKMLQEEGARHVSALAPPVSGPDATDTDDVEAITAAVEAAPPEAETPPRPATVMPFPAAPRPAPRAAPTAPPPFAMPAEGETADVARSVAEREQIPDPARAGDAGDAGGAPAGTSAGTSDVQADGAAPPPATASQADPPAAPPPAAARPEPAAAQFVAGSEEPVQGERPAQTLRRMKRGTLGARAERLAILSGRIDRLLDRMSEASGAGRW